MATFFTFWRMCILVVSADDPVDPAVVVSHFRVDTGVERMGTANSPRHNAF